MHRRSMATIREVAARARVSTATVSHVLNQIIFVSPRLKARVLKAVDEMNYHPNAMARSLRTMKSKTVGMIIPDITNPFFPAVVRGAEDVLSRAGYTLIVGNSDYLIEKEETYYRTLTAKRVDGLLLEITPVTPPPYLLRHDFERTPVVYIDRFYRNFRGDAVLVDNYSGSLDAVTHLIEAGHRRIGIITGPLNMTMARRRLKGYEQALRRHGLKRDPNLVREGRVDLESGYTQSKTLLTLNERPTALYISNGLMTMGCTRALDELGLRCPENVALISFDDLQAFEVMHPTISAVIQPTYEMGSTAANLLLKRITGGAGIPTQHKVLKTRLAIRGSSLQTQAG